MRQIAFSILAIFLALAMTPVVAAQCEPTASQADIEIGSMYIVWECNVDVVDCDALCGNSAALALAITGVCTYYFYEESNKIGGLQRYDAHHDDTCGWTIEPDRMMW